MIKPFEISRFENGLVIATTNMPWTQSVSIGVWIGCGSRYENRYNNGISHFIEHYVFKGTRRRSDDDIIQSIEGVGGEINASTSEESTVYFVQIIRDHVELAVDVLLDMVINPVFRKEQLEKQKEIVFEEIHMYEDTPANHVEDLFNRAMWDKHPLGFNILGTPQNIERMTRENLLSYKNRHYRSSNCVIVAAGDISHKDFVNSIRKDIKKFTPGRKCAVKKAVPEKANRKIIIEKRNTEQVHIQLGVPALHWRHPRKYALKIISTILGETMSSRLFRSVREEHGYAYSIGTGIDRFMDAGTFYVSGGIVTRRIIPAIKLIMKEISALTRKKVSKKEIERAKEYIRGSVLMSSERTISRMHWLGDSLRMSGNVKPVEKTIENLRKVTAEELQSLACSLFKDERLSMAIIGPVEDTNSLEKILRFK